MNKMAGVLSDISQLTAAAQAFRATLDAAKARVSPRDFEWYPYDTMSNLWTIQRLLGSGARSLEELIGGRTVLDVGCADGDLSFFLEALGCEVDAIDNPVTNFNAMRGVRTLKAELGSSAAIHAADIDAQFTPPADEYGLVVLLGILYHLKNPFYVLERLSKQARYCLLSTTLTQSVPGIFETVTGTAIGYLADIYELNRDSTNYWVFSDAGFRRLLKRSNWEICDYLLVTDRPGAAQAGAIADQRAFCLARSKFVDRSVDILYGRGWHPVEPGGWRWTERMFSVRIESSRAGSAGRLLMTVFVPEMALERSKRVTLRAVANGVDLQPEIFSQPGEYKYERDLPSPTGEGDVRIDFLLDSALPPDASDPRERGFVVSSLAAGKR